MVETYQRTELPPAQTGMVKPSYELADRSAQQRFAQTTSGIAARTWQQIIESDAALELDQFIGATKAAEAQLDDYVRNNPGVLIEDYLREQKTMMTNLKKAGEKAKTGLAKEKIRGFLAANEKLIRERSTASIQAIVRGRQLKEFNLKAQAAIETGDLPRLNKLYQEATGNLIDAETAKASRELDVLHLEAARQKIDEQNKQAAERAAEDEHFKLLSQLPETAGLKALEELPNEAIGVRREELRIRLKNHSAARGEEIESEARKLLVAGKFQDAIDYINAHSEMMGSDWHTSALTKAQSAQRVLVEQEENPYNKTMNPARRAEIFQLASKDKITHDEINKAEGKDISTIDAQKAHDILDQPAHIYRSPWAETIKQGIEQAYKLKENALEGDIEKVPELQAWKDQKYNQMNKFITDHEKAGTVPTSAQIQEFLTSTLTEATDSKFWEYAKAFFTPPVIHAGRIGYLQHKLGKAKAKAETVGTPTVPIAKRMPGESAAEFLLRKQRQEVARNE